MTSNQTPAVGFGFGILKTPLLRIFSKSIQKLAPRFNTAFFFAYFAQTIRTCQRISTTSHHRINYYIISHDGADIFTTDLEKAN